jgi:hypothetical protein
MLSPHICKYGMLSKFPRYSIAEEATFDTMQTRIADIQRKLAQQTELYLSCGMHDSIITKKIPRVELSAQNLVSAKCPWKVLVLLNY